MNATTTNRMKYSRGNVDAAIAALQGHSATSASAIAALIGAASFLVAVGTRPAYAQPLVQEPPTATTPTDPDQAAEPTEAERKARLATALKELDAAAPKFDAATQKLVPAFRAILTRYYLDRGSLTAAEMDIATAVRARIRTSRAVDLDALDNAFRQRLRANAAVANHPNIKTGSHRVPGSKEPVGYVAIEVDGREKIIAEIASPAGGLSSVERAQTVARRLTTASAADPLWWTQATVGQKKGAYVVAAPTAPDGYVITADADYARLRGVAPSKLAMALTRDLRSVFGGPAATRDIQRGPVSPEEAAEKAAAAAAELRAAGDAAFNAGNLTEAEAQYQAAIEKCKTYIPAYERLAALYADQGAAAGAKRRAIARQALTQPHLDANQKKMLHKLAE